MLFILPSLCSSFSHPSFLPPPLFFPSLLFSPLIITLPFLLCPLSFSPLSHLSPSLSPFNLSLLLSLHSSFCPSLQVTVRAWCVMCDCKAARLLPSVDNWILGGLRWGCSLTTPNTHTLPTYTHTNTHTLCGIGPWVLLKYGISPIDLLCRGIISWTTEFKTIDFAKAVFNKSNHPSFKACILNSELD